MTIKTRFAPSPTGWLHIGGIRTALFSWLHARHNNGKFVLRIEDTDKNRSSTESVQVILDGLAWLGLDYDEGPYFQTQRFERYHEVIAQLLQEGKAYYCCCSKERLDSIRHTAMLEGRKSRYDGHCRNLNLNSDNAVVRFRNPTSGQISINDLVQGNVIFQNSELDDLIIVRVDGTPTYNLTVVVDDMDMMITDVIRGDDHLNNTPRQINILKALNADLPNYAHISMIMGVDGKKLSKRHNAASVLQYRDSGYLPEALLNYLVRLGWSLGDQEIFTIDDMISLFDIKTVNKSAAQINPDKLLWLNKYYLEHVDSEYLEQPLRKMLDALGIVTGGSKLVPLIEVQKHRTKTLQDMAEQSVFLYRDFDDYEPKLAEKYLCTDFLESLQGLYDILNALPNWQKADIAKAVTDIAEAFDIKFRKLAQSLRVAVTGYNVSPSIDNTLYLLGRDKTLYRLKTAIEFIAKRD